MKIVITPQGHVRMVNGDGVVECDRLGVVCKQRASHVEPCNAVLRAAFRWLRRTFGEAGRVAAFTRRWPCMWRVDLAPSGGPILGPYTDRACAIQDEVEWIENNVL